MNEQPIPNDGDWPWNALLWKAHTRPSGIFGSLRIVEGAREYCTQCGEMIFACDIACIVVIRIGEKWIEPHFHRTCYGAWERGDVALAEMDRTDLPVH